jgi:glycosyltransferase involved in cell wall biosynthesis
VPAAIRSVSRPRLLICGRSPLHGVWLDLAAALEGRGWQVDLWAAPLTAQRASLGIWRAADRWLSRPWVGLDAILRVIRRAQRDLAAAAPASTWFESLEGRLASDGHDVVIAVLDVAPAGLARLVVRCHPRPILVSLVALTQELRYRRSLASLRMVARAWAGRSLHPDLFRAVEPGRIQMAVVPSRAWMKAAVAAGVPAGRAKVIPLGVPVPAAALERVRSPGVPARLLWAGRLSVEKGLHLFLDALPLVVARRAVTLSAIASPGSTGYAWRVARAIRRNGLANVVQLRSEVPRAVLLAEFHRHDALLFHSVFAEPVAHVMLHAAAAGLPVVGPASPDPRSLLRDEETACCYADQSPARVADAILRALDDDEARTRRAKALWEEVRTEHAFARTVAAYDALLRAHAGQAPHQENVECLSAHC